MINLYRKLLQVGCIIVFVILLAISAKPLPALDIEPSLRAGASDLPVIRWQDTEVVITKEESEISITADSTPEEIEPIEIVEETPTVSESEEDYWETQPDFDELDLLYRTVQAEGYTMGHEGMRLITDAILNLAEHQGVSVTDCITAPGQFTVVSTGAIWNQIIYQDTIDAVLTEVRGPRVDYNIKYFRTGHYHGFGHPCFRYENVYFSS